MPRYLQIIRFLKGDNKYKEGWVDGQIDTKEGKKRSAKLLAEMEKAEAFEKNEQLSYISNCPPSPISNLDDLAASSNSDLPDPSLQMPRPIHYSQLSDLPEKLSWNITPDLPPSGTLEYYLASVCTTLQRMTPELKNMADSIPYASFLPFSESGTENNEGIFPFDDLSPLPNQDKGKKPIRLWELIVEDIVEALEIPLAFSIKKSIFFFFF